jgi:endonuclease/exonuclease/phosphatase family metal-dependent hydrolase
MFRTLLLVSALLVSPPVFAQELTIASWNMGNLASGPGIELRGHERTVQQYDDIAGAIGSLNADIIALQEIGSIPGAQRILGPDYDVYFETRCMENASHCTADVDDIFTAIAVRKSLKDQVQIFQIDELAIPHVDACAAVQPRPVRGSVGAKIDFSGRTYWIPSVHLKSSCSSGKTNDPDVMDDCATLNKQIDILKAWIEAREAEGDAVIVTGDFNRKFIDNGKREPRLDNMSPAPTFLPVAEQRSCWSNYHFDYTALKAEAEKKMPDGYPGDLEPRIYTPAQFGAIDFFILVNQGPDLTLTSDMIELDALNSFGNPSAYVKDCDGKPSPFGNQVLTFGEADPSDHCPIKLLIEGPEELSINQAE